MTNTHEKLHKEELINVLTHSPGVLFGIIATIMLFIKIEPNHVPELISYLVYGISFTLLYAASSIYHVVKCSNKKAFFKKVDHACIYIFMAGCYTPFVILFASEGIKYWFLAIVWIIASAGVLYKFLAKNKNTFISLSLYLSFGFMCFLAKAEFLDLMPTFQFNLLAIGGAFYTVGAIFYVLKAIPYNHGIWHVFVLLGSASHFCAIYQY